MSIKKNNKDHLEGYIPYILGGVVVGAIALNYLSGHRSFATTSSGSGEGSSGSSSGSSHPHAEHHTTSTSHSHSHPTTTHHSSAPTKHHVAPTHHDSPLTIHHDTHTVPHTAVHKVTHPDTHKTDTTSQAQPGNDNMGFGFHKATGFGGGGGGHFGGGGGHGGSGGMNNFMGGGTRGPPGGEGGRFSHTGGGPDGHGFGNEGGRGNGGHHSGHHHDSHQHQQHDTHTPHTDTKHHHTTSTTKHHDSGGHTHGQNVSTDKSQSKGGGNAEGNVIGLPGKTNTEHNKTANIGENFKGKVTPWSRTPRDNVPSNTTPTKTFQPAEKTKSGSYDQSKDGGDPQSGKPTEGSFKTNLNTTPKINRLFKSTGRSVDGDNFGTDNEDNHGHPSNRFVGYHDFKNFEATSYVTVKSTHNPRGYAMIETGGPTQNNKQHNCCDYSIGIRTNGQLYAKEEGDHFGGTGGDDGDLANIGHWKNFKTEALKPGETFGLKTVLMRDLHDSSGNQHTRLLGYIDRNNNGTWKKMLDVTDPYGISQHTKKPFPVITDMSMHGAHVQEARTRVEDMGDTGFHPNYTDIHEIDMSGIGSDGTPINKSHPQSTSPTTSIGIHTPSGNNLSTGRVSNTSPLSTTHIGGTGHKHIDTSQTQPGAQAPGEAAIQATLGGGFTNFNSNTNTSHSIRPPSTDYASHLTPQQQARHSITGDYFDAVSHDIAETPNTQQRRQQRHSITGDYFDNVSRDITGTPNIQQRPSYESDDNSRQTEYTYNYPSTGGVIGRSNEPLTEDELFSNLAITSGNNNMIEYLAMAALIGIPLALAFNLL